MSAKKPPDENQLPLAFGTEPYKLYRPDDPETSREAAEAVDTTKLEGLVHGSFLSLEPRGGISDEIRAMHPHLPYSSITARFHSLEEKGLLYDTGERRPGRSGRSQRVMRAVPVARRKAS